MTRIVLVLLLVGSARSGRAASQQTKNLGLLLGGAAYENQNWQVLDQAVCAPGCVTGSVGNLIAAATAPFPCAVTTGGLYLDTDCAQLCRCNSGQAQWCRSDTGACLSALDCCTTTTTTTTLVTTTTSTTTTSTTTTTTLATVAAPSWVSSMLAAWMLDETTSAVRVNAQGNTSRNLDRQVACGTSNPITQDTVNKMEGVASAVFVGASCLTTLDTFTGVGSPVSVGCWILSSSAQPVDDAFVMHDYSNGANTFKLRRRNAGGYEFEVWDSSGASHQATSPFTYGATAWAHVVGTVATGGNALLYVNGAQVASVPFPILGTPNFPFYLGENSFWFGNLDECWFANALLPATSVCRICSCGIRGEQCTCAGSAYVSTGRNATNCGSCTLPATCNQATP